jgi:putative flippase GtrA
MPDNPTSRPRRKVIAGGLGGSLVIVFVWLLKMFAKTEIPAEVSAALTTIVSFVISYITPPDSNETSVADASGNMKSALKA